MIDHVTPAELARELGIAAKTIRAYLRSKYGKLPAFVTRWHLTSAQADDVRNRFRGWELDATHGNE
ncbi:hypothetical protein [Mycetocola zhujimingii]|uniref:hypothetical protein n=1 Tax=Mycetocola zhujimingii TaxID=2079792 RepID=UPI0011B2717F|nr:hypothetical protein [Mycetocola zhujimingii]